MAGNVAQGKNRFGKITMRRNMANDSMGETTQNEDAPAGSGLVLFLRGDDG
jgi:hypothetical protein